MKFFKGEDLVAIFKSSHMRSFLQQYSVVKYFSKVIYINEWLLVMILIAWVMIDFDYWYGRLIYVMASKLFIDHYIDW